MAYRYLSSGEEWDRPDARTGIGNINGPLTAGDLRAIIEDLIVALCAQVEREADELC
jgi:hypothetical protein